MLFSNLILNLNLILWVSMMYKYVFTHQPNLVSLYTLGRLHAPRQPLPPGEDADRHLKACPGDYRGPTNPNPTSQSPPQGASGFPPNLAPDSPHKVASGSPLKSEPVSHQAQGPSSLPVAASVSPS